MRRIVLAEPPNDDTGDVALDDDAAHYVTRVLRLRDGEHVEALSARTGRAWRGVLRWRDGAPWLCERALIDTPLAAPLVLIAALIKGTRWDGLLEKATELGASDVRPFEAQRSVVQVPPHKVDDRTQRWQRICDGAARQCGRIAPIRVHPPTALADALAAVEGTVLVCDEAAAGTTWPRLGANEPTTVVVGPEGGFTDDERRALSRAGAITVGLGSFVLRAETAATAALTAVRLQRDGLL